MKSTTTLQQAIQIFSEYENCREFMVALRWPDGKVRCPRCESDKVGYLTKPECTSVMPDTRRPSSH